MPLLSIYIQINIYFFLIIDKTELNSKPNKNIIETLDKVIEIHETGREKRQEAEQELLNIEKELKDKMIEIKTKTN